MDKSDIYADIAERTGGDIYIGVVGPVRSGKSTFIKRFMDMVVLPNIEDENERMRATDELPQSANGRTIMTTEPKFIPKEAVNVTLGENTRMKVRMIDCVGFMVEGAEGGMDGDRERLVNTPWDKEPVSFGDAAEKGTRKVINDHSTIGIVITTDGSVTDIERSAYEKAEEKTINELKAINKPFVVLLNSSRPFSSETERLKESLEEKYGARVIAVNCAQLKDDDIAQILESVLYEFPVMEVRVDMPAWLDELESSHWLKIALIGYMRNISDSIGSLKSIKDCLKQDNDYVRKLYIDAVDMGTGCVDASLLLADGLFYSILSETAGVDVNDDRQLISVLKSLAEAKKNYDRYERAFCDAAARGYGIVTPSSDTVKIEKPELFKQGGRYGVRLKAKGEAIHVIKTDVETRVEPVIGGEDEARRFLEKVIRDYENDPTDMLGLDIFGRSMDSLINEGMTGKAINIPDDAKLKLKDTLQKILNEGNGSLICIIL